MEVTLNRTTGMYAGLSAKLIQSVLTAAFMFVAQRRLYEAIKTVSHSLDDRHQLELMWS